MYFFKQSNPKFPSCFCFSVQKDTFAGLFRIRRLELQDNNITHIDDGALQHMRNLEYLFLKSNKLTHFDMELVFGRNMIYLQLSENGMIDVFPATHRINGKLQFQMQRRSDSNRPYAICAHCTLIYWKTHSSYVI